jgi:serine phosphatase RsbU (regulator of sigma subunit)
MDESRHAKDLDAQGIPVGLLPDAVYCPAAIPVPPASRIYIFSDGCYEIQMADGEVGTRKEMIQYLNDLPPVHSPPLDVLYQRSVRAQGGASLADDFTVLCATFA